MSFPIEEQYVLATEAKIDGKFPHSYRNMMLANNGGEILVDEVSWNLFPILNAGSKKLFKRTCNDIVSETESAKEWYGFPQDAIAIASCGNGDLLVFLRESRSKYSEKIYHWDHETTELNLVEKSFKKLLQQDA